MQDKAFFDNGGKSAPEPQRAILVGIDIDGDRNAVEESLSELRGLLKTAGGVCAARVIQGRAAPDPATYIGAGKVLEVAEAVKTLDCSLVIFDNELSPSQIRNLEKETGALVMDRSMLILDIFAMRAKTGEGKLQVALAQLQYMLPRLTNRYDELSRLGGGIGTRGPGETKLETDRRHIRERISALKAELSELKKNREVQRSARMKNPIPVVSIIGYTNAGKSTLFNRLTGASVLAEDRLFATLDPTVRKARFTSGELIFIDTVGFIKKLPHHLIRAFYSTLEEMVFADVILHVIDASSPSMAENRQVALSLLSELGASDKPVITVFNKCDLTDPASIPKEEDSILISARSGQGTEDMIALIFKKLAEQKRVLSLLIPYSDSGVMDVLHREGDILTLTYEEGGISVTARLDQNYAARLAQYIKE